ncbi:MAG TPA: DNA polymerase IV, partial [Azonexus sp.]|nr:DNA polymerase IV [Azonexus sp.]
DLTLAEPLADAQAIRRAAGQCLKRIALGKRIRLLGVRAAGLQPPAATQQPLAVQAELQLF